MRCEDLRRTCRRLLHLAPPPDEVLILADACTDETVPMMQREFPEFTLIESTESLGSSGARDAVARAVRSDIMLTLDDDSYPIEDDMIARLKELFSSDTLLAVVTFPQRSDEFPETLEQADFGPSTDVGTYVNCASAVRRETFLAMGGYMRFFWHMYDEPDLSVRLIDAGYRIRYETSRCIRHHYSPAERSELRNHHFHARNEIWSVVMRCPAMQVAPLIVFRAVRQFGFAWSRGPNWVVREPLWWIDCVKGIPRCLRHREPVSWAGYSKWMRLVREGI
jgi:GT2 family glycosyltransferase